MNTFLRSDIGRGITGVGFSIGIILAVLFPVFLMDIFVRLLNLG